MPVNLITRKQWGARYKDGFRDRPMPIKTFWLHHSVTVAPDLLPPFDDDDAAVRTLEDIGQSRFNGGISYNQPVTPVGRMYVGVSPHREGAHTYGNNTDGFAFVLVGDYSKREPTAIQQELIARRMVELHRAGLATRHTLNGGHRDSPGAKVYPTSCPGDAAWRCIPKINARADQLWDLNYPKNDVPLDGQEEDIMAVLSLDEAVQKIAHAVVYTIQVPLIGRTDTASVATLLRVTYDRVTGHTGRLNELEAKVDGITEAVKATSTDPDRIAAIVDKAVRDRLAKLAVVDREDEAAPAPEVQS